MSLCPVCLERIPARRVCHTNHEVFLEKECPVHGRFSTRTWNGPPDFLAWARPKIPFYPLAPLTQTDQGCPFDCGLCPGHRQRSCTILLEVTHRCNLACPVCFAGAGPMHTADPGQDTIAGWFETAWKSGGNCNIQISGGEPTLRDDLPDIISLGRETGFSFIQLNTNGLRMARDPGLAPSLARAGLDSVFLQFDGLDDGVYTKLRGRPLLAEKIQVLNTVRDCGLGVVLVPTLVPGVNTGQVGQILEFAMKWSPTVRAVHFQPISYFGRYPEKPDASLRFTLPELMQAIGEQTNGLFRADHFRPPGCENAWCSFHGNFMITSGSSVIPLGDSGVRPCCGEPARAELGADRAIAGVARQWAAPQAAIEPRDNPMAYRPAQGPMSMDDFLAQARTHCLAVSAMAFQDAWTLDLERVRDCCIHVMSPDNRLIPFCLYNLTGAGGRSLYRP
ncbi:MAG: radical SAM protein [Pseudomonadota bacterium]